MKELLGERIIFQYGTGAEVPAMVFREIDQANFDDFENLWRPQLEKARRRVSTVDEAAAISIQDSHWEWADKAIEAQRVMSRDTFAVECAGQTQGLMLTDVGFGRIDVQKGRDLVYVELLATAPWNRPKLVDDPQYKGVGRILIGTAISLSVELGFAGRIGLHSLPQSEVWYRTAGGFTDLGFDPTKKMHYFEMTESDAAAFISD